VDRARIGRPEVGGIPRSGPASCQKAWRFLHHQDDKASKWLVLNSGGAILRLGGVRNIAAWQSLQAELVNPGQLPDGFLEVVLAGEPEPRPFVLELATFPEERLYEQITRDMLMVHLVRRVLPDTLVLILHPRGRLQISDHRQVVSHSGWAEMTLYWKTIELWNIPAEDLLATGELGIIPWVPLSQLPADPEPVLRECRRRIDEQAPPERREQLLAVTQFLARLQFDATDLAEIFGGVETMLELPFMDAVVEELAEKRAEQKAAQRVEQQLAQRVAQNRRHDILLSLRARFRPAIPPEIATGLETIEDEARLDELVEWAAICPDLEAFRAKLAG
jgi:hypothetical protein